MPSKLEDPEWRADRARKAALARTNPEAHARALVRDWPELTHEQKDRLRVLLRPITRSAA